MRPFQVRAGTMTETARPVPRPTHGRCERTKRRRKTGAHHAAAGTIQRPLEKKSSAAAGSSHTHDFVANTRGRFDGASIMIASKSPASIPSGQAPSPPTSRAHSLEENFRDPSGKILL